MQWQVHGSISFWTIRRREAELPLSSSMSVCQGKQAMSIQILVDMLESRLRHASARAPTVQ